VSGRRQPACGGNWLLLLLLLYVLMWEMETAFCLQSQCSGQEFVPYNYYYYYYYPSLG
jgi:hypothetical protein